MTCYFVDLVEFTCYLPTLHCLPHSMDFYAISTQILQLLVVSLATVKVPCNGWLGHQQFSFCYQEQTAKRMHRDLDVTT